jgi:hypothetical protein
MVIAAMLALLKTVSLTRAVISEANSEEKVVGKIV